MTLIIGCVTKDFGIIAGDTQLSSGDLSRGEFDRLIQHKVSQYSSDFMMGILGKWSFISPMKDGTGTLIDYYKTLQRSLSDAKKTNKLDYLNRFLVSKSNIQATAIYVKKDTVFTLDCVTSDGDTKTIKTIKIDAKTLMFNEPFFDTDPDYIEKKVREFCKEHKLSDNLSDSIFLLNNIILEIISKGKTLSISVGGITQMDIPNSVGGYVTMQVMTGDIHHRNCLHRFYSDPKVLLDRTTYPFARLVDQTKKINYVDNLAMLAKSSNDYVNGIKIELNAVLVKQINFIHSNEILEIDLLNDLITSINGNYKRKLAKVKEKKTSVVQLFDLLGDNETGENYEFYNRFLL